MAVSLREYRARIKSTESMKKITRAMELIAASRIIKAQQRAQAAAPYARELTRAVSAVATFSNVNHPLTKEEENPTRAAVLVITSDRGLAGAYSSLVSGWLTLENVATAETARVSSRAYGADAWARCCALMIREAAMSSMARVIFFIDVTDLVRARSSRTEVAMVSPASA